MSIDRGIDGTARKIRVMSRVVFGDNLRDVRIERGLTQRELGLMVGENEYTINKYEKGNRSPRLPQFLDIAEALGVSPNALLGWKDTPHA